jgi:hypothetical protein
MIGPTGDLCVKRAAGKRKTLIQIEHVIAVFE